MKFRGSSKIKKEHGMVKGLKKFLEKIESWPEIRSIIPGPIKPSKNLTQPHLSVQYATKTGCSCLFYSEGIQRIFFVSSEPEKLMEKLRKL